MYPRDKNWFTLIDYLKNQGLQDEPFVGSEFLLYEFPKVIPYQVIKHVRLKDYDWEYVAFNKDEKYDFTNEFLDMLRKEYTPVWKNHLFVVFKKHPTKMEKIKSLKYFVSSPVKWEKYYKKEGPKKTGILITTYNRPHFLERLLHQLKDRREEIVVVNDGSDEKYRPHYEQIKKNFPQVTYIDNPENRGLVYSLNTGFSYLLADPDMEWIHYFQDDVIISEDIFEKTAKIAHKEKYPVITGIHRPPHKSFGTKKMEGMEVRLLLTAPAHHLLLHRQYLMDNLPIPNPYLGAPKRDKGKPGQGSDADWWLLSWSPKSIIKRGGYIIAIPGLVKTDMDPELSTWAD